MGSQQTLKPTNGLISVPTNYPSFPTPGKLEILWDSNYHGLYHRLSPYASYNDGIIRGFTTQPYNYVYPDENKKGLNALKKYDSEYLALGSAPLDVIRVSKFLASGKGIIFLGKQFLLQTGNAFNETRIYNPTSPIVAAGMGLSLGTIRPMRSFDTSGGIAGLVNTLLGSSISNLIFGDPVVNPPSGTTGRGALPTVNATTDGKGLLRAGTANPAKSKLDKKWGNIQTNKGSFISNLMSSLFANFISQTQKDVTYRSDEKTYGLMAAYGSYPTANGEQFYGYHGSSIYMNFHQRWFAGIKSSTGIRYKAPYPQYAGPVLKQNSNVTYVLNGKSYSKMIDIIQMPVGYDVIESTNPLKPGIRYGDSYGISNNKDGIYGSDIMLEWGVNYLNNDFPSKHTDKTSVDYINDTLKATLNNIASANNGTSYKVNVPDDSSIIRSGKSSKNGYDRLMATTNGMDKKKNNSYINYPLGIIKSYRDANVTLVDDTLNAKNSYHFPTSGKNDTINTLSVLDKTLVDNSTSTTETWKPYNDDLVALFFYDVINEKYIPLRAMISGLSENTTANWEELSFVGRSDKVYSYSGFSRNLSFTLKIVISSITELLPTWQKINYIMTMTKPGGFTTSILNLNGNAIIDRFSVPPMFMLTLGDLYKYQPIIIQTVGLTIPDDASWETLNEENSGKIDWSYLCKIISAPNIMYAQLPREVELHFTMFLLEKERAVVGGANFGHAPRNDDWNGWNTTVIPNGGEPTKFNKSLVVDVTKQPNNNSSIAMPSMQSPPKL